MWRWLQNVFRLGIKELASISRDTVMIALIVFEFTAAVYSEADSTTHTAKLIAASQASWAWRDSTPSRSATKEPEPRTTTSTAAPISSSGTTSATLLTVDITIASTNRPR